MADVTIGGIATSATVLADADLIEVEQGGVTKKAAMSRIHEYATSVRNAGVTNQSPAASATTLLTGSTLAVPPQGLRVKSMFRYSIVLSKTAAGTVAVQFLFKMGTAGTTADATIQTYSLGVGTAAADEARVDLDVVIIGPINSTCANKGALTIAHRLTTTGFYTTAGNGRVIVTAGTTFDATVANLIGSLSIVLGASYVVTVEHVASELVMP